MDFTEQDLLSLIYPAGLVYKEKGGFIKSPKGFQEGYDPDCDLRSVDTKN